MVHPIAALIVSAVFAQWEPPFEVEPQVVTSPSGAWRARITPGDRNGTGPCDIAIERDGEVVAHARPSFTFEVAAITDSGFVVGHGRTDSRPFGGGEFVVGVVSPQGAVVRDERTERVASRFMHRPPNPSPEGMLVDPLGRWFIIRIADPDVNRRVETWWNFPVTTADAREDVVPQRQFEDSFDGRLSDARVIPDTQWFVVNWRCFVSDSQRMRVGGRFTVIDRTGAESWRIDLPDDYEFDGDADGVALEGAYDRIGPILAVGPGPTFALWHIKSGERVEYRVDVAAAAGARVIETSRQAFDGPAHIKALEEARWPTLPTRRLEQTAAIPLLEDAPPPPLRDLCELGFGQDGDPIAIRRDGPGRFTAVLFGAEGGAPREVPWEPLPGGTGSGSVELSALGAGRWLVSARTWDHAESSWFLVDGASGTLRRLDGLDREAEGKYARDAIAARGTADGGFVAIVKVSTRSTILTSLVRVAADGSESWHIDERHDFEEAVFSPVDVTVLADGTIAVLENIRNDVKLYDDTGHFVRTIDLEQTFGGEPNYVTEIHAHPDGGFLIEDFHGATTARLVTRDGALRASFTPQLESGHRPEALARNVEVAPDGTVWTRDDGTLFVLDDAGTVTRAIGPADDPNALTHAGAIAIDALGRAWIHDSRADALHGFDAAGKRLWVARFAPEDGEPLGYGNFVVSRPDGGILVHRSSAGIGIFGPSVRFEATGRRVGRTPASNSACVLELADDRFVTSSSRRPLTILDGHGETVAQYEKTPDGRWTGRSHDAVLNAEGRGALLIGGSVVFLDEDGAPTHHLPLPNPIRMLSQLAWNGDHVLVADWPRAMHYSFTTDRWEIVTVADETDDATGAIGLSPHGTELLAVDSKSHVLRKFQLE